MLTHIFGWTLLSFLLISEMTDDKHQTTWILEKSMQDQWRVVLKTSGLSTDVTLPKRHGEVEFLNDFPN